MMSLNSTLYIIMNFPTNLSECLVYFRKILKDLRSWPTTVVRVETFKVWNSSFQLSYIVTGWNKINDYHQTLTRGGNSREKKRKRQDQTAEANTTSHVFPFPYSFAENFHFRRRKLNWLGTTLSLCKIYRWIY